MLKSFKKFSQVIGILLLFLLIGIPVMLGIYSGVNYLFFAEKDYVLKIGSSKIKEDDLSSFNEEYRALEHVSYIFEREAADSLQKKLNIEVNSELVNDEYKRYVDKAKSSFPSYSDKEAILYYYNQTPNKLRRRIYFSKVIDALREAINNLYVPTEKEIEEYFDNNYSESDSIDDLREDIISSLKKESNHFEYIFEKEMDNLTVEVVDDRYSSYLKAPLLKLGNLSFDNYQFNKNILYLMPYISYLPAKGDTDKARVVNYLYDRFEEALLFAREAQRRGIKSKKNLSSSDKITYLSNKMADIIKSEIDISDEEVLDYYEGHLSDYTVQENGEANIVFFPFKPSKEDIKNNRNNVEALLESSIESNELPEGYGIDILSLSEFRTRFNKQSIRDGEVIPTILGDDSALVIAKRSSEEVSFITFKPTASSNTLSRIEERAQRIFNNIKDGEITIAYAMENYSDINFKESKKVKRNSSLDRAVVKSVLEGSDELQFISTDKGIYIVERISYSEESVKELDTVRDKILNDLKNRAAESAKEKLLEELREKEPVKVKKTFLTEGMSFAS